MNWFQKFFSNPNVHAISSGLATAASMAFPQYAAPLQVVAGTLAITAAAIPENPVVVPTPVAPVLTLPTAAGGGSYHAVDYAALGAALLAQLANPQPPK